MSAQQSLQFVMSLNLRATKRLPGRGGGREKVEGERVQNELGGPWITMG